MASPFDKKKEKWEQEGGETTKGDRSEQRLERRSGRVDVVQDSALMLVLTSVPM